MPNKVNMLAYRFGKGAENEDCREAPALIYTHMQDILRSRNILFSWQETIPEGYCFPASEDEQSSIKNKIAVVEAVTSLAEHVMLSMLSDEGLPFVIGGDHTQALGASKGMIVALTAKALMENRLAVHRGGAQGLGLLERAVEQRDRAAIKAYTALLVQDYVTPQALKRFLSSLYVIWFDAHGDYNTTSTTPSGNAHGMGAASIAGLGDMALTAIMGSWAQLPPENMYFVAVRDLDAGEEQLMRQSGAHIYPMEIIRKLGLKRVITDIMAMIVRDSLQRSGMEPKIHLSFDVDGMDAKYVPATGTPVGEGSSRNQANGPTLDETVEAFTAIAEKMTLIDLAESNFDPARDPEGITLHSVTQVISGFFAAETTAAMPRYYRGKKR